MPMSERTTTTVQRDDDGYYRTRVPKALGDAMDLGGTELAWRVVDDRTLTVQKVGAGDE